MSVNEVLTVIRPKNKTSAHIYPIVTQIIATWPLMENISQIESEDDARKKRIQMYKSVLNYYRSRSLSLDHILSSKQVNETIPPAVKTEEGLNRAVQGLYDDITLSQSLKQCMELVRNSLSSIELTNSGSLQHRLDIVDKIEGIIYFSRSLMQLYESRPTELEVVEKMKIYLGVLTEYSKSLEALKESQKEGDMEVTEKAKLQVYKINLIRAIKSVLIGFISVNCPEMLSHVEQFRSPMRRNLTVDDFTYSWDLGISSS